MPAFTSAQRGRCLLVGLHLELTWCDCVPAMLGSVQKELLLPREQTPEVLVDLIPV